jgi:5'-3' exonuclease
MLTLVDSRAPRAVVACMGAEQADYRVRLYPPYHAHREPMPPALAEQWQRVQTLIEGLGWTYATSDDLEADDVMFSHARAEQAAGGRALLLTGDRDLYGAVSDSVFALELRKGGEATDVDPAGVRARYGVDPQLVPDFIALRGDPSDGLPGAPGIGAKTAAQLLNEHGSLEALIDAAEGDGRADGLRPRVASALRENAELLQAFKQIATLQSIEVHAPPDAATDFAAGARVAGEMGMRRLAERLSKLAG